MADLVKKAKKGRIFWLNGRKRDRWYLTPQQREAVRRVEGMPASVQKLERENLRLHREIVALEREQRVLKQAIVLQQLQEKLKDRLLVISSDGRKMLWNGRRWRKA